MPPHGEAIVKHSIIWGHWQPLVGDVAIAVSHSLVEGTDPWPGEGNLTGNPLFHDPGEFDFENFDAFGRPGFVVSGGNYVLANGSPALNAGPAGEAPALDHDARPRHCGTAPDLGAYESDCPAATPFLRGDADSSGDHDLTDAIFLLGFLFRGEAAPSCEDAADTDDSGELDLTDAIALLGYLFRGTVAPPAPFSECGVDPTESSAEPTCIAFDGCP